MVIDVITDHGNKHPIASRCKDRTCNVVKVVSKHSEHINLLAL